MIIITTPILPDYVTAWSWAEVPNAVAGPGDEPTFYLFRFTIANQEMNLGWSYEDLTAVEYRDVRAAGSGWQSFWDTIFEKMRAKVEAKGGAA